MAYKNSTGFAACAGLPLDMAVVLELRMPLFNVWVSQTPRGLRAMSRTGLLYMTR